MFSTTLNQTRLHILSYLKDLATGNEKRNMRMYYKDYKVQKKFSSIYININISIEKNKQTALPN